jgi:hypothetical protein
MCYILFVSILASFFIDGFVWLYLYFNLCKNIGFKNAILSFVQYQLDVIKQFFFLLIGYHPIKIDMIKIDYQNEEDNNNQ